MLWTMRLCYGNKKLYVRFHCCSKVYFYSLHCFSPLFGRTSCTKNVVLLLFCCLSFCLVLFGFHFEHSVKTSTSQFCVHVLKKQTNRYHVYQKISFMLIVRIQSRNKYLTNLTIHSCTYETFIVSSSRHNRCNGWYVCLNGTTSTPKSVLRCILDYKVR